MLRRIGLFLGAMVLGVQLWASGATYARVKTWSNGDTLTAGDLNAEFDNILNNGNPAGMDDYSNTLTEMRAVDAPYPASVESQATSLQGELTRLRYQQLQILKAISAGHTYWYEAAPTEGVFTVKGSSVGVNNTSPTYTLDVTGSVRASTVTVSSLTVTGYLAVPTATNFSHMRAVLSGDFSASGFEYIPINTWTDSSDSLGEMGVTTFTATTSGKYLVCATLIFFDATQVGSAGGAVYVNGAFNTSLFLMGQSAADEEFWTGNGCSTVPLTAGDLLTIRVFAFGGGGTSVMKDAHISTETDGHTVLTIDRLF